MVAVCLIEWRWPGVDLLWFIPKSWRQASPLYAVEDYSTRPKSGKRSGLDGLAVAPTGMSYRSRFRAIQAMPSLPEEDIAAYDDAEGEGEGLAEGEGEGAQDTPLGGTERSMGEEEEEGGTGPGQMPYSSSSEGESIGEPSGSMGLVLRTAR
ncbi:hypothetical protein TSOC_005845, partial [Tetrabaena socialis]